MTEVAYKIPALVSKGKLKGKIQYTPAKGQRFNIMVGDRLVSFVLQYGWNGESAYDNADAWSCISHLATGWRVTEFNNAFLAYCVNSGNLDADPLKFASRMVTEIVERVGSENFLSKTDAALVING